MSSRGKNLSRSRTRSRSRSASRDSDSRRGRRDRSKSKSRERSIDEIVKNSLSNHLSSFKMQLLQATQSQSREGADYSVEMKAMKEKQQQLDITTKAASLNSVGGQSQYRSVASLQLHMKNALSRLEEVLLLQDSPEDPIFVALSPARNDIVKGIAEADERLGLIIRADADPKVGWRALSIYENKQKTSASLKLDSEKEKIFSSCLKEVQEEAKKKASINTYSKKPFRPGPSAHYTGGGFSSAGSQGKKYR